MPNQADGIIISLPQLEKELKKECPFKESADNVELEGENIKNDDSPSAKRVQASSGGTLGKNLEAGSSGAKNTINSLYAPPMVKEKRKDTKRTEGKEKIEVKGISQQIETKNFPFTLAAHHLIPGNASLEASALIDFMTKDHTVDSDDGKSWEIIANIGYNVNGGHNGVWLPGNYAIRRGSSPLKKGKKGKSWSELASDKTNRDWCFNYVMAVMKKCEKLYGSPRQFHDTHEAYSGNVEKNLNKIHEKLMHHLTPKTCPDCKDKKKIPPPYRIKNRLYSLSTKLRGFVTGDPKAWVKPWFTSDSWEDEIINNKKDLSRKS